MIVIGVDPGAKGAWAAANMDDATVLLRAEHLPNATHKVGKSNRTFLVPSAWARELQWLQLQDSCIAYVERVHAMPKQGVVSVWNFGQAYGTILGVLGALNIPTVHVSPPEWKAAMRLGRQHTKDDARALAMSLYPRASFHRKLDHNRAEAALIASYGVRKELGA